MKYLKKSVLILGLLATTQTFASDNIYVGGSIDMIKINSNLSTRGFDTDDKDTGFSFYVGKKFKNNWMVDVSYINSGTLTEKGQAGDLFEYKGTTYALLVDGKVSTDVTAILLSVGYDQVLGSSKKFHLKPMIGLARWSTETDLKFSNGTRDSDSDNGYGLSLRVDATYEVTKNVEVGANLKQFMVDSDFVKLSSSLGFIATYKF